ncbi:MAG: type II toxin-antitoxin system HicA family toxin [Chloroflexi bacterium]|nr:type II toxin-antitoxin system HicA family toxin [Chloroflexota bacterium]MCY3589648.1 type II toxin-antitoxin system HicA family toxin [Chloroflexota bacterium]MCY3687150.1 type II toxin-antitoxin system HicA family toxin [Chloroflexota bacterium]MDE2709967.1 type II toxin-antitoxin system HicA family toxin [Chloroflexota bacterium]
MARARRLRAFELERIVERHGFKYDHHTGSHIIMKRHSDGRMAVIPDKGNRPVPPATSVRSSANPVSRAASLSSAVRELLPIL